MRGCLPWRPLQRVPLGRACLHCWLPAPSTDRDVQTRAALTGPLPQPHQYILR